GGAFFWELSSDRQAELIGATFNALNNGVQPPPPVVTTKPPPPVVTTKPPSPVTSKSSSSTKPTTINLIPTTTQSSNGGNVPQWQVGYLYAVNDLVMYEGIKYQCRQAHRSQSDWIPPLVLALWLPV
ncbi:unnamed protein product, partial [Rotaria sp. Silwood1]